MKKFAGLVGVSFVLLTATPSHAEIGAPAANTTTAKVVGSNFGKQGQILVFASTSANLGGQIQSGNNAFVLSLDPSMGYFINDQIFIGGLFGLNVQSGTATSVTFSIGPTIGVHLPLTDVFSALPSFGLEYDLFSFSPPGGFGGTTNNSELQIKLRGDFLYHVAPHFSFIGGPYITQGVGNTTITQLGINVGILGWFTP